MLFVGICFVTCIPTLATCKEQPIKEVTKKLMVTSDFGFFMKASHEVVQTLSFSSKKELHQLTTQAITSQRH